MFTFILALFLFSTPDRQETVVTAVENNGFSLVCYAHDGYLQLGKIKKGESGVAGMSQETGISTNDIEKITLWTDEQHVGITIHYFHSEAVRALFDMNDLSLQEIGVVTAPHFAELSAP